MKRLLLSVSFLFTALLFTTEGHTQHPICGDGILKSQLQRDYPEYMQRVKETFEEARAIGVFPYRGQEVYTIPVVIHVVWNEEEENLHDSIILNQMKILNEDFRRLNADADSVRPVFQNRVGDPGIEFELVRIVRVQTEEFFTPSIFGLPDQLKSNTQGGSDAWDTEKYLNLWICKIQPLTILGIPIGQVLGYAYPPANLEHWPDDVSAPTPEVDGVVVDYRIFGRNSGLTVDPGIGEPISGYGRTAVHEIGHFLGLRHIWGDGGGLFGGDGCEEDDGVEDTPNQKSSSNFTCDHTRNTCTDPIDNLPDMIENYMDYSTESCMNSFTYGQIAIMRAVLEGPRKGLIQTTSTEHLSTKVDIGVFPNPSVEGIFNLKLNRQNSESLGYQIYDALGQLISQKEGLSPSETVDLSNRQQGMYFLRIYNTHSLQMISAKKLVIPGM